jgi:hypothetical protein
LSGYRRFDQALDEPAVGSDGRTMQPGDEWITGQLLPGGELNVGWAEHLGDVARFAKEVEGCSGIKIHSITGTPSLRSRTSDPSLLGDMIREGTFSADRFARSLERELGSHWQVNVDPHTGKLVCQSETS